MPSSSAPFAAIKIWNGAAAGLLGRRSQEEREERSRVSFVVPRSRLIGGTHRQGPALVRAHSCDVYGGSGWLDSPPPQHRPSLRVASLTHERTRALFPFSPHSLLPNCSLLPALLAASTGRASDSAASSVMASAGDGGGLFFGEPGSSLIGLRIRRADQAAAAAEARLRVRVLGLSPGAGNHRQFLDGRLFAFASQEGGGGGVYREQDASHREAFVFDPSRKDVLFLGGFTGGCCRKRISCAESKGWRRMLTAL